MIPCQRFRPPSIARFCRGLRVSVVLRDGLTPRRVLDAAAEVGVSHVCVLSSAASATLGSTRACGGCSPSPAAHRRGGCGAGRGRPKCTPHCLCCFVSRAMLCVVRLSLRTFAIRFRNHFWSNYSPFFGRFLAVRLNVQGAQNKTTKNAKSGSKNGRKTAAFLAHLERCPRRLLPERRPSTPNRQDKPPSWPAGCFLALGSGLGLVGTVSARR